ncbi:MAG: metallophosphoesterase family protein [Chloroflexi bacterium]|nr:metallophosphoesterase family protein [Chloroflexota bacterium]
MIALCLADLHSNVTTLRRLDALLARRAHELGLVLAAGDITIPGHEPYAADFVGVVKRHNVPLLVVHGNNDTIEAVETFRRAGVTIHRSEREIGGFRFAGFGGDGTAPHDFELAEGETLDLRLDGAIFLTHVPPQVRLPYGPDVPRTKMVAPPRPSGDALAGAPRAHICGHIHHIEGVAYLGPTKVVKLRAAMLNRCALLDVRTLRTDFRDLGD